MSDNNLLDVLTREGVLITVSVRYWRAAKRLKAEDLGLDPKDITDLISLGHKKLLPREALEKFALIEGRAHSLIDSSTFPFLNGVAHFLPNKKLAEVTGKLSALETEFHEAHRDFISRYSLLRTQACRDWWDAARKLVKDPSVLVATIEDSFPAPDKMARYFTFDVNLFQISVPERLGTDLITLADQQSIVNARQEAARSAADKISQDTDKFVADCVATMRQETAQICNEMLESMKGGKTDGVHQKTLNRLMTFIDQFKSLNFAGDHELENMLENARKELLSKTAEDYRDNSRAQGQLRQGLKQLADTARDMAQANPREIVERFGQMGIRRMAA